MGVASQVPVRDGASEMVMTLSGEELQLEQRTSNGK
jgi:hypothetical protein